MPKLAILICTLVNRKRLFDRLLHRLKPQLTNDIKVFVSSDNGVKSVGRKRNELMQACEGFSHMAYVDDDDLLSPKYCKKILQALESDPDCVGIEGQITTDGRNPRKFIHSLRYNNWYEENGIYYRSPNHLNPIRRDIGIQVPFMEVNHGEDSDFSKRILPLLKTEQYIDDIVYYYNFISKKHERRRDRR